MECSLRRQVPLRTLSVLLCSGPVRNSAWNRLVPLFSFMSRANRRPKMNWRRRRLVTWCGPCVVPPVMRYRAKLHHCPRRHSTNRLESCSPHGYSTAFSRANPHKLRLSIQHPVLALRIVPIRNVSRQCPTMPSRLMDNDGVCLITI